MQIIDKLNFPQMKTLKGLEQILKNHVYFTDQT